MRLILFYARVRLHGSERLRTPFFPLTIVELVLMIFSLISSRLIVRVGIRDGRIKRGQLLLLEAVGGSFTWGSALIRLLTGRGQRVSLRKRRARCRSLAHSAPCPRR